MKPVLFIIGPTCTGKTDLAFYLSDFFKAKILNADSLQVYQGFDIGTAKPDLKKIQNLYLFDHIQPPHIYTAGQWEKDALKILNQFSPSNYCFVVGGSGFYLQALEKGSYPVSKAKENLRQKLLKKAQTKTGALELYQELEKKDPEYAGKIHPHDSYRVIRALSFIQSSNKKLSVVQKKFKPRPLKFKIYKIGLTGNREALEKRVRLRVQNMIYRGLISEVQKLVDQGLGDFPPMQSVGYKETLMYLRGEVSKEDLVEKIIQRTMGLIKKQKTWFKRDSSIRWYDCETNFKEILDDLKKLPNFSLDS